MQTTTATETGMERKMRGTSSGFVVFAALTDNVVVALSKYGAAWLTGSSAMLSVAIHSSVNCGNPALLMVGLCRSSGLRVPPICSAMGWGLFLVLHGGGADF